MAKFSDRLAARLTAPLAKDDPRVRVVEQRGASIPYIPHHEIVDSMNLDFGFDGWEWRVVECDVLHAGTITRRSRKTGEEYVNNVVTARCTGIVVILETGQHHHGVGVCTAEGRGDEPPPYETAVMGAESVAKRRAAKNLGNRYGNSLSDRDDPHGYESARAHETVAPPPTARAAAAPDPEDKQEDKQEDKYAVDPGTGEEISPATVVAAIERYYGTHGRPPACVVDRHLADPSDLDTLDRAQLLELWTLIHEEGGRDGRS